MSGEPSLSWAERFYTHFVGRDLTYLFAGGLFIWVTQYAWFGNTEEIYLPGGHVVDLLGFLLGSYFLGLALSETQIKRKRIVPTEGKNHLLLYQEIIGKKYDASVLNRHERTVYFMHVGVSLGISCLAGAFVMLVAALYRWPVAQFSSRTDASVDAQYVAIMLGLTGLGIFLSLYGNSKLEEAKREHTALLSNDGS